MENKIHLSSSPNFTKGLTTQKTMAAVLIVLLSVCIAGVVLFGIKALITIGEIKVINADFILDALNI